MCWNLENLAAWWVMISAYGIVLSWFYNKVAYHMEIRESQGKFVDEKVKEKLGKFIKTIKLEFFLLLTLHILFPCLSKDKKVINVTILLYWLESGKNISHGRVRENENLKRMELFFPFICHMSSFIMYPVSGYGRLRLPDNSVYQGHLHDHKKHGEGTQIYRF